jgi:transcription initiation factor TFIIH subunit 4
MPCRERDKALQLLSRLYIITVTPPSRDDPQTITLTQKFGESLRLALTGGGEHNSFGVPSNDSVAEGIDLAFLDEYAREQWEGILHYVVNSVGQSMGGGGQGPTDAVKQLLEAGKLVTTGRHSGKGITQAGFSFLLQEVNAQVWTLLLLWIENAEQVGRHAHTSASDANINRWNWIL